MKAVSDVLLPAASYIRRVLVRPKSWLEGRSQRNVAELRLLVQSCLSVCPRVTAHEPLISYEVVVREFYEIC